MKLLVIPLALVLVGCTRSPLERYDDPVVLNVEIEKKQVEDQIIKSRSYYSVSETVASYAVVVVIDIGLALIGFEDGIPLPVTTEIRLYRINPDSNRNTHYQLKWGKNNFVSESKDLQGEWVVSIHAPRIHLESSPFEFSKENKVQILHFNINDGLTRR